MNREAPVSNQFAEAAEVTLVRSALSRQAIYDSQLRVWAYELQHVEVSASESASDRDQMTSSVILAAFAEFGLERVVGQRRAFIHASLGTLTGDLPLPIPSQRVVLQVRDYSGRAAKLESCLRRRKDEGFRIALDEFLFTKEVEPLLNWVDYVKLDFQQLGGRRLRENVTMLNDHAVDIIATGLGSSTQVRACEGFGVRYFQGDFLFKPQLMKRKELPSSFLIVSDLLERLQNPDVRFEEIERIVKRDAALSVAVLRFLNSSAYGFRQEVSSLSQAVALLGLSEFTKWALLVAMSSRFDKPTELLMTALVRARTCENFAKGSSVAPEVAFMVGLLSVLDALLDRSLDSVLVELPVTREVKAAVLELTGPLGEILENVLLRENALPELDWEAQTRLTQAWLEAVEWAEGTRGSLAG